MMTKLPVRGQAPNEQRGFSLIEVLIAMLILSIAIIALADMFLWAIKKNAHSAHMTRANQLATQKLEELFAMDFGSLTTGALNTTPCQFNWAGVNTPIPVQGCALPCPAYALDTVTEVVGYNNPTGGTAASIKQLYDRCWWISNGPQNFTGQQQTRILRVVVRPRMFGFRDDGTGTQVAGKVIVADLSMIKAGNVGGAFTRN